MVGALLFVDGCPNRQVTDIRLRKALADVERGDSPVEYRIVSPPEKAEAAEFRGSPTVLVNGQDPIPDRERPVGPTRRMYRTEDGLAGSPTVRHLIGGFREAPPPLIP